MEVSLELYGMLLLSDFRYRWAYFTNTPAGIVVADKAISTSILLYLPFLSCRERTS